MGHGAWTDIRPVGLPILDLAQPLIASLVRRHYGREQNESVKRACLLEFLIQTLLTPQRFRECARG